MPNKVQEEYLGAIRNEEWVIEVHQKGENEWAITTKGSLQTFSEVVKVAQRWDEVMEEDGEWYEKTRSELGLTEEWTISIDERGNYTLRDNGEDIRLLKEVPKKPRELLEDLKKTNGASLLFPSNDFVEAKGKSLNDLKRSLKEMDNLIDSEDGRFVIPFMSKYGPMPTWYPDEDEKRGTVTGVGLTRAGSGRTTNEEKWNERREIAGNFTLTKGILVFEFEHFGQHSLDSEAKDYEKEHPSSEEGYVQLVRNNPGWFDEPKTLFAGTSFQNRTKAWNIWQVTEGEWRDPHPHTSYHLEVNAAGAWRCNYYQARLGEPKGEFPHRIQDEGGWMYGPFRTGRRTTTLTIEHDQAGPVTVSFYSLDGADLTVLEYDGQLHLEDEQTGLLPGKEYVMVVDCQGVFRIELNEGY